MKRRVVKGIQTETALKERRYCVWKGLRVVEITEKGEKKTRQGGAENAFTTIWGSMSYKEGKGSQAKGRRGKLESNPYERGKHMCRTRSKRTSFMRGGGTGKGKKGQALRTERRILKKKRRRQSIRERLSGPEDTSPC